jgi:hypothetical protein
MTEEKVVIQQIEAKSTKSGTPMWTITTSAGKMSCFDKAIADQLFSLINKTVALEIQMQGTYKNIKKFIREESGGVSKQNTRLSSASCCISYAKDLCVAGKIEIKELYATAKGLLALYEEMCTDEPEDDPENYQY